MATSLRTLVAGTTVGNWRAPDDQTYDVNVRLAPESRTAPQDLERLPFALSAADGTTRIVRLNQVAQVSESTGANQINRRDLTREVAVNANVAQRSAGEVSADIRKALDSVVFPRLPLPVWWLHQEHGRVVWLRHLGPGHGHHLHLHDSGQPVQSFLQPLALMTSLPLTLIGVVLALLMFRSTLSMFSIIGVVMLMGLVTKMPSCWWTSPSAPAKSMSMTQARPCPACPVPRPCCWLRACGCAPSS